MIVFLVLHPTHAQWSVGCRDSSATVHRVTEQVTAYISAFSLMTTLHSIDSEVLVCSIEARAVWKKTSSLICHHAH
jgi:hypothetical protein